MTTIASAGARLDRLPISPFHYRIFWLIAAGMFLAHRRHLRAHRAPLRRLHLGALSHRDPAARQRRLQHVRPRRRIVTPLVVVALFKGPGVAGVLALMIALLAIQIAVVWAWGIEPARRGLESLSAAR
jgi:hypothetical protein